VRVIGCSSSSGGNSLICTAPGGVSDFQCGVGGGLRTSLPFVLSTSDSFMNRTDIDVRN